MRSYKLKCKNFDPVMERRTNVHTNERTDERKSENIIPPHTYVRGIIKYFKGNWHTFRAWGVEGGRGGG